MKKKIMIGSICVLLVIVLISVPIAVILSNPLRGSDEKIRKHILELTPIGMDMEEVIEVIGNNKKWRVVGIDYEKGYLLQKPPPYPEYARIAEDGYPIIGEKSIEIFTKYTGEYSLSEFFSAPNIIGSVLGLFSTAYVTASWGFDENSKLVDVEVFKHYGGL